MLLDIAYMISMGAVLGNLVAMMFVWLFTKHESIKDAPHYRLIGTLHLLTAIFYSVNLASTYLIPTQTFNRWLEIMVVAIIALMSYLNYKKAKILSPKRSFLCH